MADIKTKIACHILEEALEMPENSRGNACEAVVRYLLTGEVEVNKNATQKVKRFAQALRFIRRHLV